MLINYLFKLIPWPFWAVAGVALLVVGAARDLVGAVCLCASLRDYARTLRDNGLREAWSSGRLQAGLRFVPY